jgi:hypothetical protein
VGKEVAQPQLLCFFVRPGRETVAAQAVDSNDTGDGQMAQVSGLQSRQLNECRFDESAGLTYSATIG